jgi:hypothetical protein
LRGFSVDLRFFGEVLPSVFLENDSTEEIPEWRSVFFITEVKKKMFCITEVVKKKKTPLTS